jgi:hypothetical protein
LLFERTGAGSEGSTTSADSVACCLSGCGSSASSCSSSICSSAGSGEGLFALPLFDRRAGDFAAGVTLTGVFFPVPFDDRVGGGGVTVASLFARAMPLVTRRGGLGSRRSSSSSLSSSWNLSAASSSSSLPCSDLALRLDPRVAGVPVARVVLLSLALILSSPGAGVD